MLKKEGRLKTFVEVFLIAIFIVIWVDKLTAENIAFSELKTGYNSNITEDSSKKNGCFNNYSLYFEHKFLKLPLKFDSYGEVSIFSSKNLHNNYLLNNEFSINVKSINFNIGNTFYSDKNDTQNSFNSINLSISYSLDKFKFSYSIKRKYFTSKYIYGSYKEFFMKKNKNMKKINSSKIPPQKNMKGKKIHKYYREVILSKHEIDYEHSFNVSYILKNFSITPLFILNKSNINYEEYFLSEIDFEYIFDIKKFSFNTGFFPFYKKYARFNRKDFLIDFNINIDYYFSEQFFTGFQFEYKKNNSNLKEEDFEKFVTSISIGLNF